MSQPSLLNRKSVMTAILASFAKLTPRYQLRNPVMFVVFVGAIITLILAINAIFHPGSESVGFIFAISVWLWFTVLFANFAEAIAEGRGKAQAESLKKARVETMAKKLRDSNNHAYTEFNQQ